MEDSKNEVKIVNFFRLVDQVMIQQYVLLCGQDHKTGGMRDKPGKISDFYHSCYALAGLSLAQTKIGSDEKIFYKNIKENELVPPDPVFNVNGEKLKAAKQYFRSLPKFEIKKNL